MKYLNYRLAVGALVAAGALGSSAAHATWIDNGLTYSLYEQPTANPLIDQFTFQIDGINCVTNCNPASGPDTEGGRSGLNGIAFNQPVGIIDAKMIAPPSGYTYQLGGLNSGGCNTTGNFFCFKAVPPTPSSPALPANSSLDFVFEVTLAAGNSWADYAPSDPHFKVDWAGTQNNYNLVSQPIGITPGTPSVPSPGNTLGLLGIGLIGTVGAIRWNRRRQSPFAAA
jgi:hypothetical protein